jgi:6-phosphogluconolactonase/glucosamine-6-phosphate isomerase/deaminase
MHLITSNTPDITAGEQLASILQKHTNTPTLLMLSGGSALAMLEHVPARALRQNLTITTLDERYSIDPKVNNFNQIITTEFYQLAQAQNVSEISTLIENDETFAQAAKRFELALQNWRATHPQGVIIATMGVGTDGHTSGIFPNSTTPKTSDWVMTERLINTTHTCPERISVTPLFLREQVSEAISYIVGEQKRDVLQQLKQPDCSPAVMPACIIKEMRAVTIVTDLA